MKLKIHYLDMLFSNSKLKKKSLDPVTRQLHLHTFWPLRLHTREPITSIFVVLIVVLQLITTGSQAQSKATLPGLKIGDVAPDVTMSKILNYPGGSAKISDFKDKLLILDFWATWCSACISHFPENYAIQQEYGEKVKVLLVNSKVTRDTEEGLKVFFNRRKSVYQFPCVIMDTALTKMFPHKTIPHYVIIKNRRVLAITDGENVNIANIGRMINDNNTTLFLKKDIKLKTNEPFFFEGNGGEVPQNYYRSFITGRLPVYGCPNGFQLNENGLISRIYAVNYDLLQLYIIAYPEFSGFTDSRIIYNIPHSEKFVLNEIDSIDKNRRVFSYESTFPSVSKNDALQIMKTDLSRFFQLKVDSQYRDTLCYVLRTNNVNPPKKVPAGIIREMNISERANIPKYFHDFGIESLRNELEVVFRAPFFDETGYSDNVSLDLPANIRDVKALTASLKNQGIILTQERRKISYMIIKQN